jgi:hypothetical protein
MSAVKQIPAASATSPQFHLGCVTYNLLKNMLLDTLITTLEAVGIGAVELRTGHKHGVEPSIGPEERMRVRERFQHSKVRLLSYGTICEFQSPAAAERKHQIETAKLFIELASDTGAMAVKVRPKQAARRMEVHGRDTQEPKTSAEILATTDHKKAGAGWNSNPTESKEPERFLRYYRALWEQLAA